jgi:hypothetical protein
MRHTAISEWLGQGIDIGARGKAVCSSVKMIEKHYQQLIKFDFIEKLALFNVVESSAVLGLSPPELQAILAIPRKQERKQICRYSLAEESNLCSMICGLF